MNYSGVNIFHHYNNRHLQIMVFQFLWTSLITGIFFTFLKINRKTIWSDFGNYSKIEFAVDLDDLHRELQEQIAEAQKCYQGPADSRWTSVLDNKCSSRQLISGPQDLRRSYWKRILYPSKLSLKLDQHPSPYDSPNIWKPYTLCFMFPN